MKTIAFLILTVAILSTVQAEASAEKWTRAYIRSLPDSAFAVIETSPDGRKIRRLPHHDLSGAVDRPHLDAALRLWHRTHWLSPENARIAWDHLQLHVHELVKHDRRTEEGRQAAIPAARISAL